MLRIGKGEERVTKMKFMVYELVAMADTLEGSLLKQCVEQSKYIQCGGMKSVVNVEGSKCTTKQAIKA